jgi:hypothetical protein
MLISDVINLLAVVALLVVACGATGLFGWQTWKRYLAEVARDGAEADRDAAIERADDADAALRAVLDEAATLDDHVASLPSDDLTYTIRAAKTRCPADLRRSGGQR